MIKKDTGDGIWYLWVYAKDKQGNETIARSEGLLLDNTAPNAEVSYSTKALTKSNVKVTITANEEIQGVNGWTLSSDKKSISKEYSSNTKESVVIKDIAGNEKTVEVLIENIEVNTVKKGDMNGNDNIDTSDLIIILRYVSASKNTEVANKHPSWLLTEEKLQIADINEDGKVNAIDLTKLLRHIAASKSNETAQKHPDWLLK